MCCFGHTPAAIDSCFSEFCLKPTASLPCQECNDLTQKQEDDVKLVLAREQKVAGIFRHKEKFKLTAWVDISEEEWAHILRYRMGGLIVYERDRITPELKKYYTPWGILINILSHGTRVTITVADMTRGRSFVCRDIREMLAIESDLRAPSWPWVHQFLSLPNDLIYDGWEKLFYLLG